MKSLREIVEQESEQPFDADGGYVDVIKYWVRAHLRWALILICMIAALELLMYGFTGLAGTRGVDLMSYALKYLLIPTDVNLFMYLFARVLCDRLRPRASAMVACLLIVGIVTSVYTFHNTFDAVYIGYAIAIFMTIPFGDLAITSVATAVSIVCMALSDIFVVWDASGINRAPVTPLAAMNFGVSILGLLVAGLFATVLVNFIKTYYVLEVEQAKKNKRLYRETLSDPLTHISNRTDMRLKLDRMVKDSVGGPYFFVMLDIDFFKGINDTFGHEAGDQYLITLATILDQTEGAEAFRYGGDEFSMLFNGPELTEVMDRLHAISTEFRASDVCKTYQDATLSFGLTRYMGPGDPIGKVVKRADKALYQAKEKRGSIVFVDGPSES